jgi:hypothetical protein
VSALVFQVRIEIKPGSGFALKPMQIHNTDLEDLIVLYLPGVKVEHHLNLQQINKKCCAWIWSLGLQSSGTRISDRLTAA